MELPDAGKKWPVNKLCANHQNNLWPSFCHQCKLPKEDTMALAFLLFTAEPNVPHFLQDKGFLLLLNPLLLWTLYDAQSLAAQNAL